MYEVINRGKELANKIVQSYSDKMFAGVVVGNNPGSFHYNDKTRECF